MSEQTETCLHRGCHCPAKSGEGYCSKYCSEAGVEAGGGADEQAGCGCGHPDCMRSAAIASPA